MNDKKLKTSQSPHNPTLFRVGEKVFDANWSEYEVKNRKNWSYVVVNREQVGVSKLENKEGYCEPVYFGYVFKGLFEKGDNFYYDILLKNKR